MGGTGEACEVCGAEVGRADALLGRHQGYVICGSADCRGLVAQLAGIPEHGRAAHFAAHRKLILERRARQERNRRHEAMLRAAEAREEARILAEFREARGFEGPVAVLPLPSGPTGLAPLARERRERYRRHLERTIQEALTASPGGIERDRSDAAAARADKVERLLQAHPALDARTGQACGRCKGGCCTMGQEHGFVSTATVRRLVDADPTLTAEGILETYLGHLSEETVEASCVNHGPRGCVLPRAWRSDVCNAYFCEGLKAFQKAWTDGDEERPVLMIRRAAPVPSRFVGTEPSPVVETLWMEGDEVTRPLGAPLSSPSEASADPEEGSGSPSRR